MFLNFLFGNPNKKTVGYYTKIFFFMIIPVFGLFYTLFLAFIEDRDEDINKLAKGALIIRIIAIALLIALLAIIVKFIIPDVIPNIEKMINNSMVLMRIFR